MPVVESNERDLPLVFETMRNFGDGVDSYRDPIDLEPNQSQNLVNILIEDKLKARTRPGADKLFDAPAATPVLGLQYFDTPVYEQLLVNIGVNIYEWNNVMLSAALAFHPNGLLFEAAQMVDKVCILDGSSIPQSYDGAAFTPIGDGGELGPPKECTLLCAHAGRMWASGNPGFNDSVYTSDLLDFSAGHWSITNKSFRVGQGEGDPIMAMASMQQFTLCVLKRNSIWLSVTDPTNIPGNYQTEQASEFISEAIGCVGRRAWAKVGNDVMFMADEGVMSVQRMLSAQGQWELSSPISEPVQNVIDRINPNYNYKVCAIKYRSYVFWGLPLDVATETSHTLVYNWRLKRWMGLWQGWTPTVFQQTRFGGIKHLVFGDTVGLVNQWKDLSPQDVDATYLDNTVGYPTREWCRSMVFGDLESPKTGFDGKVRFNNGNAAVTFTAVGSDVVLRTTSTNVAPSGDILGEDDLPFLLSSQKPSLASFSLRGLPAFNELYLKVESESGYWSLRNLSLSARVRPLKTK